MQNIGKIYNQEWEFPIRTPNLQIYIQQGSENETWYIKYSKNRSLWKIDNKLIKEQNFQISLGFVRFFLYLPPLSDEYLYEIEKIAQIILDAKDTPVTFEALYRRLRKLYETSELKPKKHYLAMLSFSKCFIQISISDTIGNKIVTWRVHKDNLSTFKSIKRMVQNIYIDTTEVEETVRLFYVQKPKKPQRPAPPSDCIKKIPVSAIVFNRNKDSAGPHPGEEKKTKRRKRARSI